MRSLVLMVNDIQFSEALLGGKALRAQTGVWAVLWQALQDCKLAASVHEGVWFTSGEDNEAEAESETQHTAPVGSQEEFLSFAKTFRRGKKYVLRSQAASGQDPKRQRALEISLWPRERNLALDIELSGDAVAGAMQSVLPQFQEFVLSLSARWQEQAMLGPDLHVAPRLDTPYPRPYPPRRSAIFSPGCVAIFASRRFFHEQDGTVWEKLTAAPLPPGAVRTAHGDLLSILFTEDASIESLPRACGQYDRFMAAALDWKVDPRFNPLGDMSCTDLGRRAAPPLTAYEPSNARGLLTAVPGDDGALSDSQLAEIRGWLATGRLPDGTALRKLRVALPDRQAALRNAEPLREAGASTLYTDELGRYWDPFPPGPWLTD